MKEEVKAFFESGKLEEYLMGLSSQEDRREVEHFLENYPIVKKEYDALQKDIETYAESIAKTAPSGTKSAIINEINTLKNSNASALTKSVSNNWGWAAAVSALIGCAMAVWFWSNNSSINSELQSLQARYDQLSDDCDERSQEIAAMQNERALLLHPATQTVILEGDALGTAFYASAFWNKEKSVCHLNVDYLPKPPDKHCFQIWADVDGEMVNLGVLPVSSSGLVALPFKVNATSLNVTIEPEGGSEHPTVTRIVASVPV